MTATPPPCDLMAHRMNEVELRLEEGRTQFREIQDTQKKILEVLNGAKGVAIVIKMLFGIAAGLGGLGGFFIWASGK